MEVYATCFIFAHDAFLHRVGQSLGTHVGHVVHIVNKILKINATLIDKYNLCLSV